MFRPVIDPDALTRTFVRESLLMFTYNSLPFRISCCTTNVVDTHRHDEMMIELKESTNVNNFIDKIMHKSVFTIPYPFMLLKVLNFSLS